jgi:double-stranded uracil-DNA glycosylase
MKSTSSNLLHGLPPIATSRATCLILGSMPGVDSLRAQEYYAHPRNAFWSIMGELCGAAPSLSYAARSRRLNRAGISVWDVIAACRRPGSLDSKIELRSVVVNHFDAFFCEHPKITRIFFNGATSEALFTRYVRPRLTIRQFEFRRLPSTSPANAGMKFEAKREAWSVVLEASGD